MACRGLAARVAELIDLIKNNPTSVHRDALQAFLDSLVTLDGENAGILLSDGAGTLDLATIVNADRVTEAETKIHVLSVG